MGSSHPFRNAACPCGSGRKFKRCCGAELETLPIASAQFSSDLWLPRRVGAQPAIWFGRNFTVEIGVYLHNLPTLSWPSNATWATLYAAGDSEVAVNYTSPATIDGTRKAPYLRIGLCNRELRVLLELAIPGRSEPFRLWMNEALKPRTNRPYHIAAIVNTHEMTASLAVDSAVARTSRLPAIPMVCNSSQLSTGAGTSYLELYSRVWRRCLTPKELAESAFSRGVNEIWDISFNADKAPNRVNIATHGPVAHLTYLRGTSVPAALRVEVIAGALLQEAGVDVSATATVEERCRTAATTLTQLVESLEQLINDPEVDEPRVLAFFRETPAASFLLCPTQRRHWREQQIQDHGQIDFLFETSDEAHLVMEIESPKTRIFKQNNELNAAAAHAIDQVETWMRGVRHAPETVRRHYGDAVPESFVGEVVIGRSEELNSPSRRTRWHEWKSKGVLLKTWDDVINRARELSRRMTDPVIVAHPWL